ncbi:MAG TPA: hypothetical protein PKI34_10325, partial [Bacteroidales bacterium]|nr:hypothetical protein [Bacteroidales bacterium]
AWAFILAWRTPRQEVKKINELYADTSLNAPDRLLARDAIFDLRREESFLQSRLTMAKNDSICLTLDMHDSLLVLELQGVVIHQAKVHQVKMSPIFSRIHRSAFFRLFGEPFKVDSCRSTIIKEPIIVQKAPADTIEAARQETVRDTTPPPPATFHLYLNKDIELIVMQTGEADQKNEVFKHFIKTNRNRYASLFLGDLFRFQVPDYRPWIRIYVGQDDAITIYRAIPYHSLVTIRI